MSIFRLLAASSVLLCALAFTGGARAATPDDAAALLRLATCQDSWYEWRDDGGRLAALATLVQSGFERRPRAPGFVPKRPTTLLGHAVVELYPQSVGMGVGFSVTVNAPYDRVKADFERALGRTLADCSISDGMHACELRMGEKKTALLMSPTERGNGQTLLGCYYFYQQ